MSFFFIQNKPFLSFLLTIFQDHKRRDPISVYIAGFLCGLAKAFPNTRAVEASLVAPFLWLLCLADHQGSSLFPLGREHIPFLSAVSISKGPLITHLLRVHQPVRTICTSMLDVAPDRPLGGAGGILGQLVTQSCFCLPLSQLEELRGRNQKTTLDILVSSPTSGILTHISWCCGPGLPATTDPQTLS